MEEIVFNCDTNLVDFDSPLSDTFVNGGIEFRITNMCKNEVSLFHDKTFVIPYYKPYTQHASNEDQTVIRFFDEHKNEIFGSFTTVNLDSTFVDPAYFIPTVKDTATYTIQYSGSLKIRQKIVMSYFKDSYWITVSKNKRNQIQYIKLCISKGKNKKNTLYGISCSGFIKVI
ncbi:MAG: hypothetical protein IPI53_08405 [Saprospiraceae bacterium]|nr:hypothetical protein [Saprospiraceae bacterium]